MKNLQRVCAFFALFLFIPMALAEDGWGWTSSPTPGALNLLTDETGETAESYSNGTLSDDIVLSEILPNPEGSDTETEWIELYNMGTDNVDLGNWSLDDEEEGSTPYIFPAGTTIEAQDFLVIYRIDSNLSLNNDTDQVRLFDFEGTLKDNVTYEGSPEAQSYARIELAEDEMAQTPIAPRGKLISWLIPQARAQEQTSTNSSQKIAFLNSPWEWTSDLTVGSQNPIYYFLQGTVQSLLPFENSVLLDRNGATLEVSLAKLDLNDTLKKSIFSPGETVSGYATQTAPDQFELKRLEDVPSTVSLPIENESLIMRYILLGILLTGGLGFILWQQKKQTRMSKANVPSPSSSLDVAAGLSSHPKLCPGRVFTSIFGLNKPF
ncbi:MAG: lamin tail domain-containing protein [Candidatus Gracilibacteria bacterium]